MITISKAKKWLKTILCVCIAFGLAFVGEAHTAYGQFENDFRGTNEPIRDSALMPADFQREIQSVADKFDAQSIASNLGSEVEHLVDGSFGGDPTESMVNGIKNQLGDLDLPRVFGSLAIVLGGYFGLVWLTRRFGGRSSGKLPNEVVEVLGQTPFKPGHTLQLIRLGNKLLLLMNGPEGSHTIGEISDPQEVARLCSACGASRPNIRHVPAKVPASPSTAAPTQGPNTDLKQILRQLQRVADDAGNGAVFEA